MSTRPDFVGNPNLIELATETLDPPLWLAMALIQDTAANPPKTQGEAIDRVVALCKHAIAMATDQQAGPLKWRVVHIATGETVAAFSYADVALRYIASGADCGGWRPNELRLEENNAGGAK